MDLINDSIMTKKRFQEIVLDAVKKSRRSENQVSYMDVITEICIQYNIQIEDVGKLINDSMKEHLRVEAESRNMIKREGGNKSSLKGLFDDDDDKPL